MLFKGNANFGFNLHKNKNNPYIYYTDAYFNSAKRLVRGALLAITRPVLCTAIVNQCSIDEKEFFSKIIFFLHITLNIIYYMASKFFIEINFYEWYKKLFTKY